MIRHIRSLPRGKIGLTIPRAYCEMLGYTKGMPIYNCIKGNDLILYKTEKTEDDGYDFVEKVKLQQQGASETLIVPFPRKIVLILDYKWDQEVQIKLKGKGLHIYKMWGE